jgi:hypothetical protein
MVMIDYDVMFWLRVDKTLKEYLELMLVGSVGDGGNLRCRRVVFRNQLSLRGGNRGSTRYDGLWKRVCKLSPKAVRWWLAHDDVETNRQAATD